MWGYAVAAIAGAWWANSKAPAARVSKAMVMGAKTGRKWQVEYLEDLGVMLIIEGSTRAAFRRTPQGWECARATGNPAVVSLMRRDFDHGVK